MLSASASNAASELSFGSLVSPRPSDTAQDFNLADRVTAYLIDSGLTPANARREAVLAVKIVSSTNPALLSPLKQQTLFRQAIAIVSDAVCSGELCGVSPERADALPKALPQPMVKASAATRAKPFRGETYVAVAGGALRSMKNRFRKRHTVKAFH